MLAFLIPLLCSLVSLASTQVVGNGGHGINENGKIYALDLYEYHLEQGATFQKIAPDEEVLAKIHRSFPALKAEIAWLVASKLQEIYLLNQAFSLSLVKAIEFYRWDFSDSRLTPVDDENLRNRPEFREKLIQLAVRSHYSIQIDPDYFSAMDSANQVALVIHEAVHALINPEKHESGLYSSQNEQRSRSIVAFLFSPQLNSEDLLKKTAGAFPSRPGSLLFENKNVLVASTSLVILEDGVETGSFSPDISAANFLTKIKEKLKNPEARSIAITGFADFFRFSPQIYESGAGSSHWYLGFDELKHEQFGPVLELTAKNPNLPALSDKNAGISLENLCGDSIEISFAQVTEEKLSYALPCLERWLKDPADYF